MAGERLRRHPRPWDDRARPTHGLGASAATLGVRAGNTAARALYRRLGFTYEGPRPGYYPDGEDAVIMWRRADVAHPGEER